MNTTNKKGDDDLLTVLKQIANDIGLIPVTVKISELDSLGNKVSESSKREKLEQDKLAAQRYAADMNLRTQLLKGKAKEDRCGDNLAKKMVRYEIVFRNKDLKSLVISEAMHKSIAENAPKVNSTDYLIHAVDGDEILSIRASDILYINKV